MGLLTFKGGIHPDDGKRFSKDQPIHFRPVVPQGELFSRFAAYGAPAKPVVKKGDCVLKGRLLKREDLYLLRSIHLSQVRVERIGTTF